MKEQEIKALFMAQYLGQNIFRYDEFINHTYELCGGHLHQDFQKDSYLLLRSVSQLTDDEAMIIARQNRFTANNDPIICAKVGRDILKRIFDDLTPNMCLPFESADYLRSIGILLPFREYTVTDIISKGWAKLV